VGSPVIISIAGYLQENGFTRLEPIVGLAHRENG